MKDTENKFLESLYNIGAEIEVQTAQDRVVIVTVKLPNGFVISEQRTYYGSDPLDVEKGKKLCLDMIAARIGVMERYANMRRGVPAPVEKWSGERLKAARLASGMSQKEVAEKMGIKQPQFARYENGVTEPTATLLQRISCAIGCSMDDLV